MEFTFKLTEQEAQLILNALIKEPYVTVVDAVNKLQGQANEQMMQKQSSEVVKENHEAAQQHETVSVTK